MVILTKKIIDPRYLVLDTNILHCDDKTFVVNEAFDAFLDKHRAELELHIRIPYVVFGELLFQQTTSALKTLSRANDSIERLSKVTNKKYSHQITEKRIKKEVQDRLTGWFKANNAEIIETPVKDIDWKSLIESSIWRKPPFSYDPKKDDLEKGFRDAVILETLCHFTTNTKKPIIFVTTDSLLREAAEGKLKENKHIKIMATLDDVDSYFKLLRENFTESFVDSITDKASSKFFDKKNTSCIVYKENLTKVLKELAGPIISNPSEIQDITDEDFDPDEEWTPLNKGMFTHKGKSQFISLENGHTFLWKEDVVFDREFDVESWDRESQLALLTIKFHVNWKANVSENGRFTKVTYLNSELVHSEVSYENS